eukprot:UN11036
MCEDSRSFLITLVQSYGEVIMLFLANMLPVYA